MASRKRLGYLVGVSLLALATSAATAKAATLVGLTADNKLVKIDTATVAASAPMAISSADKVLGIDVRFQNELFPADGPHVPQVPHRVLAVIQHLALPQDIEIHGCCSCKRRMCLAAPWRQYLG